MKPEVTVICTCYNQAAFVKESLEAVWAQTYDAIQLIIIDNASTDDSRTVIQRAIDGRSGVIFLRNTQNVGLCKAFNRGLEQATGKYVIDLAADDLMHPQRIEKQVQAFEELPKEYGVVFSNAVYIDANGQQLGYHYAVDAALRAKNQVPSGDVYKEVLRRYFICTPTVMMRKSVLMKLGGFDENLSYEDFDFFVRSAHGYQYYYLDELLMYKRVVEGSMATHFYKVGNSLLRSSWEVCNKAYDLSRSQEEYDLLAQRIREFIKKCFVAEDAEQATAFRKLLNYIEEPGWKTDALVWLCQLKLPINSFYQRYAHWQDQRNRTRMQQGVPFMEL
ncbi:MAG: glycosyltransferase [Cytophagia bacterium]|jgi:glycosyltransferase involved in cell wall biosynthesis|nr:MAG: glycosyltransferase [Runella sp.]TAG23755.1 MAG: glycosyltransferase [Cytophagales bacterium]TAG43116.1 MAG: glycosyltransferase [Cytophagia bacterium]TAG60628.1 MAG: glycosyltransferase [Runella slithyformis]TAG76518.1 MAG: glycosyltransferase [Cytophagales bacterium]